VLDTLTILGGDLTMPVVNTYGSHDITQDLGQVFTMFPHARPVSFLDSKGNEWVFHPLAKSSPRSWARADTPPDRTTQPRDFNPQKDTQGPLTLAALVVARANPSENARQPAVLLVGDSDFASNAFLHFSGNTDFILHAVAWLAEEKDLVTIAPKDTTCTGSRSSRRRARWRSSGRAGAGPSASPGPWRPTPRRWASSCARSCSPRCPASWTRPGPT